MRTDITFPSGDDQCAGWLYRPEGFEGPRPLIVMAHGFSGTKELRLPAYAERFCAAGIGVLLFDYRHFGASGGEPRELLDISRQQADFHSALAYARELDWVDPRRVGLFGSSFSGGHVLAVGAADGRVAAIVSQCPFTDGLATMSALGGKTVMRAGVAGLRDQLRALRRDAPYYIPAIAPPGSLGIITKEEVQSDWTAILEQSVDVQWVNRVAGRVALRIGMYRPGLKAAKLPCPALFCIADQDSVVPAGRTAKLAARGPRNEVKHYPVRHFEIYVGEAWERAVADQTEFLVRTLKP
ncbi:alpha/beta hydrolase [Mycobacterium mantenii]|uniref:Alpha/beta hydrolase n=1 Tax=Mycobacterium mantenii TaxID=560555 RepID=A0A1A2T5J1_MYCNT|nr:alpha/beta fold hydrolase [Mycobacterium mantenii]OBH47698.1 alpha/beta hydrolase [Mycobacterium mantenii]OBH66740.1 alpha/beta hydrolase [Mycobacterium mantenii]OBH71670.1 alpha/beta hydrolase [Mycobacterium mantenii]